jgi:ATP-dependent helicase/nuclease subunit A
MINVALATAPQNNVVVHAAAGTGKTWLLTSRIVRLLLAGSAPGAILAITFTRKAAGEIQQRVMQRLLRLAAADEVALAHELESIGAPADARTRDAARGLYEKHLDAIHALRATTFHAFCQDILRRFPLEAQVPPDFELLEATAEIEDAAWQALDRRINRDPHGALAGAMDLLLREYGTVTGARQALTQFLDHRGDWWAYTEEDVDPPAAARARLKQTLELGEDNADPLAGFLADAGVRRLLTRYAELLAAHPTATNQKFSETITRALSQDLPPHLFEEIAAVFFTGDGEVRRRDVNPTLIRKIGAARAAELAELHRALAERIRTAQARLAREHTLRLSSAWYVCGQAWLEEYQRLKAQRGLLDFTDLEWKTCRLLNRSRHAEWVQYKLDQRIDHLLVDEFQDTNPTQWRLLQPLMEEMIAGDPERQRSVFLVGDEKQSIYRFRRADPRLLHAARDWLVQHARARTFEQHISWRSSLAIIRFVNLVFHGAGEEDHDPEADFVLEDFHPHETQHAQLWGRAELLPLIARQNRSTQSASESPWRNPLEQPRRTEEDMRHRREADLIAGKIRELLGTPLLDGEGLRPLHGGDVMILLRDRAHADYYEEALRRAGIAYIGTGRGAFLHALEVRDLIQLLRALNEPYNDLALAVTLRSPLFAATDADLVTLAQQAPLPWRERLQRLPEEATPESLARARELLARWRDLVDRVPVHDLLDRIYAEGNLIARFVAAAPAHLRSRVEANLNRFLELALEVDSGRYPSLGHFLARLERQAGDDAEPPAEPAWNREPRVRIMTIHAAKGLEAPVVFLADAARDTIARERGARALIEWPAAAVRPQYFHLLGRKEAADDASLALLQEQRRLARREEANLLYVALTRARQILYVSGCEPARGGRGWYGFIEKRLRRAYRTGEAGRAGLEILSTDAGGMHARIAFGSPPAMVGTTAVQAPAWPLDPALTRPLPPIPDAGVLHPSRLTQAARPDDDTGTESSEARSASQRRGVAIHRMLEQLLSGADRAAVEEKLRRELGAGVSPAEFSAWWREACATVDDPLLRDLFDPGRNQAAYNEVAILYRDGDRDVYGVIDRVLVREREIVLIDYKTHAHANGANIAQLAGESAAQIRQYGSGARLLWPGKELRMLLLFTACRMCVEIEPQSSSRDRC